MQCSLGIWRLRKKDGDKKMMVSSSREEVNGEGHVKEVRNPCSCTGPVWRIPSSSWRRRPFVLEFKIMKRADNIVWGY